MSGFENKKKGRDFYTPALLVAAYAKSSSTLRSCWCLRLRSRDVSYCVVCSANQGIGVLRIDLALRVQRGHSVPEVREFLDGIGVFALSELRASVVQLGQEARLVLLGFLAEEGGLLSLYLQRGDPSLAISNERVSPSKSPTPVLARTFDTIFLLPALTLPTITKCNKPEQSRRERVHL